jgi:cytochrome c peroxidase
MIVAGRNFPAFPHARTLIVLSAALVQACGDAVAPAAAPQPAAPTAAASAFYNTAFERVPTVAEMTEAGRALFSDRALSASGAMACAGCHDPRHAHGPADARAVRLGGPDLRRPGVRSVPSLRYGQSVPPFTEHFHDSDGDDSIDQGPVGGRTWDGRVSTAHDQARLPLLSAAEMANASPEDVVARLRSSPSAALVRATFGNHVLDDPSLGFAAVLMALEVFQQSPGDFYPYDSKYDAYLRGQARHTAREARGLTVFNDPAKGNCAVCHPSAIKNGAFPAFTDYGFVALGVPRNRAIPANADPEYFDLGLCGPQRIDLGAHREYCGLFRTPSLRNVALRRSFFHNGVFHDLRRAVEFYARRDTDPAKWYPRLADGKPRKFDDLPPDTVANVNADPPFGRQPGGAPALTAAEIDDVVAFLRTLTDGYRGAVR